ncbi:transglycosylase domain-containing protein [Rickettsia endosymbiont of Ceutorhynchus obstrictus]|uniref:transglycosylase domain-containing protein n=2 Tax=Rickettsia TaxID=780 RepID=UPI0039791733
MRISLSKDDKYRIYTSIDAVPSQFIEAVLLYEDKYFYFHPGINPISLFEAFYFTYLKNGRKIGASTITMQVARIRFGINSGTILGKLYQIIKAIHLELHYSKNEILEAYLNLIPYGGNIEGVAAASYIYFGRELKDLNLLDILSLAVIPQNPVKRGGNCNLLQSMAQKVLYPSPYPLCHSRKNGNPEHYSHPEFISGSINEMLKQVQHDKKSLDSRLRGNDIEGNGKDIEGNGNDIKNCRNNIKRARLYLFSKWLETHPQDIIYDKLLNLPIKFNQAKNLPFIAPHFTLDILAQNNRPLAEFAYKEEFEGYTKRRTAAYLNVREDEGLGSTYKLPLEVELCKRSNSIKDIFTTIDKNLQTILETQIRLYINAHKQYGITNASAMLVDFTNMEVLASVGSGDFFNTDISGQINGTKSYRSPGSTLKPFVYALAFDQSLIHPLTLLKDSPINYDSYKPENFDSSFTGGVSAGESLIKSRNIPVIFLASKLKNPNFYEFLRQAKIAKLREPEIYGLSIVLGAVEVNMEELVTLYAMLGNLGSYQPLKKLIAPRQEFIYSNDPSNWNVKQEVNTHSLSLIGEHANPPKFCRANLEEQKSILLSKEASYLTLDILKDTARLHAYNNIEPSLPIYWKTGTSSSFRDGLAVGIFGKYVLAVWIGDFKGQVRGSFTGVETAAPLFFNIINAVINKTEDKDLILDKAKELDITKVSVCADTGDIYNGMCPSKTDTWFIKGKSPIKPSGIYRKILIDINTGMPACSFIEGQTEYRIVNFWPTDLLSVYKKAGIHLLPKPLGKSYCDNCCSNLVNQHYQKPKITSPIKNSVYSIKNSDRIILAATVDPGVSDIFWFVNDELINSVKADEPLLWQAKIGEYIIRVIDNNGESDAARINFKD